MNTMLKNLWRQQSGEDVVEYALPFGPFGRIAHGLLVERDLRKIFDYRTQQVGRLLGSELR